MNAPTLVVIALVPLSAWRVLEVRWHGAAPGGAHFVRSPLTLAVLGTVAGYYAAYAAGLLRWRARSGREAGSP